MGRSAMDGVGEKAPPPPSLSVGERGSKKMCRFGVSAGVSGVAAPLNTAAPQVTRPGVYGVARPGAGAGAGAGAAKGQDSDKGT